MFKFFLYISHTLIISLITLILTNCSSATKTESSSSSEAKENSSPVQISTVGENLMPKFSPEGDYLIYISRKRTQHAHAQVYTYNIQNKIEKRITFSDGDAFNPQFVDDNHILYESTTDEIKELYAEKGEVSSFAFESPPTEIYHSDIQGDDIDRMTFNELFDGNASISGTKNKEMLFSSFNSENKKQIYVQSFGEKKSRKLSSNVDSHQTFPIFLKKRKQICWIEETLEKGMSIVCLSIKDKKKETLKDGFFYIKDMSVINDENLMFSVIEKPKSKSKIQLYVTDKNCILDVLIAETSIEFAQYHQAKGLITYSKRDENEIWQNYYGKAPEVLTKPNCPDLNTDKPDASASK